VPIRPASARTPGSARRKAARAGGRPAFSPPQSAQTSTASVLAGGEPTQGHVDAAEHLGLHLQQPELDVPLDAALGTPEIVSVSPVSIRAPVADAAADVAVNRATVLASHPAQMGVSCVGSGPSMPGIAGFDAAEARTFRDA